MFTSFKGSNTAAQPNTELHGTLFAQTLCASLAALPPSPSEEMPNLDDNLSARSHNDSLNLHTPLPIPPLQDSNNRLPILTNSHALVQSLFMTATPASTHPTQLANADATAHNTQESTPAPPEVKPLSLPAMKAPNNSNAALKKRKDITQKMPSEQPPATTLRSVKLKQDTSAMGPAPHPLNMQLAYVNASYASLRQAILHYYEKTKQRITNNVRRIENIVEENKREYTFLLQLQSISTSLPPTQQFTPQLPIATPLYTADPDFREATHQHLAMAELYRLFSAQNHSRAVMMLPPNMAPLPPTDAPDTSTSHSYNRQPFNHSG